MNQSTSSCKAQYLVEHTVLMTYVMAAVEDYSIARLSWEKKSYRSFGWIAGQCTEKLLKACLLINDKKADFSHPSFSNYKQFLNLAGNLVGKPLTAPESFSVSEPYDEPIADFITRLIELGQANLRYREVGYKFETYDLHKFDELVFRLSRCLVPLDSMKDQTTNWRKFLKENPSHFHCKFSQLVDPEHRDMFYKDNYSFNPLSTDNKPQLTFGFGSDGFQELKRCRQEGTIEGKEAYDEAYKFLSENSKLLPKK